MAKNLKNFLMSAAGGLLLALAYPGWKINLGFLAWFGLVPIFLALKQTKKYFWTGFSAGLVYFLLVFRWFWAFFPLDAIGVSSHFLSGMILLATWLVVSAAMAGFWGLFGFLFSKIKPGSAVFFLAPAIFTIVEFLRSIGFGVVMAGSGTLFGPHWTMGAIAYSLSSNPSVLKISSFVGIYGVLFLLVLTGYFFSRRILDVKNKKNMVVIIFLVLLIAGSYFMKLPSVSAGKKIPFAIIQTNEFSKIQTTPKEQLDNFKNQLSLLNSTAKEFPTTQLVVFPEASDFLKNVSTLLTTGQSSVYFKKLFTNPALIISGARILASDQTARSRVYALESKEGILGFYDKRLLTPGGEFLPYPFRFAINLTSSNLVGKFGRFRELIAGENSPPSFVLKDKFSVSPVVCSELLSPSITRQAAKNSDIIVGMSSTAIYHGSMAPVRELLAINRFRAAENGKPLVFAANMGLSYTIDRQGQVSHITSNEESQILTGAVDIYNKKTWYNRFGDWPILLLSGFMLITAIFIKKYNVNAYNET